ncbi:MAG: cell division protein ZapD [Methylophaga sp.]|nr:cell division protein ZapD [Methylophaga sp.]
MPDNIIYEQPLNERIRTFLRLEFLFKNVGFALRNDVEVQSRDALNGLLSILSVFDRSDLKQEITKELERLITALSALENSPGVDKQALEDLLAELDQIIDALHLKKSAFGQSLRENDFLYSIRQRSSIPGGTCDFDLPAYHYWLEHTSNTEKRQQLLEWSEEFSDARAAIGMTLRLIRSSTGFSTATAQSGFYQHSLDNNQSTPLIRVRVPKDASYFPEISGGKHRFTVRFMKFDINQRAQQVSEDIEFSLSCCTM